MALMKFDTSTIPIKLWAFPFCKNILKKIVVVSQFFKNQIFEIFPPFEFFFGPLDLP